MPGGRNGSGTFILPEASFVAGSTISSAAVNDNFSTIATALSQSIAVDGQTPITGSLKFANGAASAPSISTIGDSGTGFSFTTGTHSINWSFNGVLGGVFNSDSVGGVTFNNAFNVGGALDVTGNAGIDGTLTVDGVSTLTGDVTLGGTDGVVVPNGTTAQRPGSPGSGLFRFNSSNKTFEGWNGATWVTLSLSPRGYIDGFILSQASGTQINITAGTTRSDDNTVDIVQAGVFGKTTSAWVLGSSSGGLDTGAIAANTWYYFYAIFNPTTGASDFIFTATVGSPTLPTGWTKKRYIGSVRTDGSSNFISFTQVGDYFRWATPTLDFTTSTLTTSSTTITLNNSQVAGAVPNGISVLAKLNVAASNTVTAVIYLRALTETDTAPSTTVAPLANAGFGGGNTAIITVGQAEIWTNTSQQIAARANTASTTLNISVIGWIDQRGKNS